MASTQHPLYPSLLTSLTQAHLAPDRSWLSSYLSQSNSSISISTSTHAPPNLASLLSALKTHILSSTILSTLDRTHRFPGNISSTSIATRSLSADTTVQILDILDLGHSAWTQLQDLEMDARGERVVGRNAVVRVVEDVDDEESAPAAAPSGAGMGTSAGPWKVLLQDAAGALVWAFDGEGVLGGFASGVGSAGGFAGGSASGNGKMPSIGCKLVLRRGCVVARGTVLLDRAHVLLLGGRIQEMHDVWMAGRIERLKAKLQTPR